MIVKQVSVFVENTVGRLAELTKILTDNDIDLKASTIAETVDFGILRCIVEDPEKTVKILTENGFSASISEVTGVSLEDKPGGLHKVLAALAEAGIAVNYIYSTIKSAEGKAIIMISSELPEVMGMSDRIVVMHEGTMTAIVDRKDFSSELILKYATSEVPYQPAADEK